MEMNYAGFWRRFAALAIDGIIVWLLCLVTIIPYWIPPLGIIIAVYYHVVFETSELKGTPGKVIMNIMVTRTNGETLTIKDSIIRFIVSFISSAIFLVGYFMSLFTQKRQTLHDLVADTIVTPKYSEHVNYIDVFMSQSKKLFNRDSVSNDNAQSSSDRPVSTASLEELYQLFQKGILTEAEYNTKKEEFLKRL